MAGSNIRRCTTSRLGIPAGTSQSTVGCFPHDYTPATSGVLGLGVPTAVTIDGAHNDSTTTIAVSAGTLFRPGMEFTATTAETFKVVSISSNDLTVATRPYSGTAASLAGSEVVTVSVPPYGSTMPAGGDGIVDVSDWTHGTIEVGTAWTSADIAVLVCNSREGTFVDLYDGAGNRVKVESVLTAQAAQYRLPDDVFRSAFFRLESISTADESAVVQTSDRNLVLTLKR